MRSCDVSCGQVAADTESHAGLQADFPAAPEADEEDWLSEAVAQNCPDTATSDSRRITLLTNLISTKRWSMPNTLCKHRNANGRGCRPECAQACQHQWCNAGCIFGRPCAIQAAHLQCAWRGSGSTRTMQLAYQQSTKIARLQGICGLLYTQWTSDRLADCAAAHCTKAWNKPKELVRFGKDPKFPEKLFLVGLRENGLAFYAAKPARRYPSTMICTILRAGNQS